MVCNLWSLFLPISNNSHISLKRLFCDKYFQEEKAELRSHNYVLEKEKRGLELQVHVKRSQERVYTAPIEHFRAELQKVGKGERHQEEWRAESNHEQLCEESNQDDQQQTVQLPDEHVRV